MLGNHPHRALRCSASAEEYWSWSDVTFAVIILHETRWSLEAYLFTFKSSVNFLKTRSSSQVPIDGSSRYLGEYTDKATINDLFFQRFLFTERRYNKLGTNIISETWFAWIACTSTSPLKGRNFTKACKSLFVLEPRMLAIFSTLCVS